MATKETQPMQATDEDIENAITKSFLSLEKIDVDLYRSRHLWKSRGSRAVYGGQVVGQALTAAAYSVPSDHFAHSLHCYFLRPGDVKQPILYMVDHTRDGNVYSSRSIKAMQEGQAIFTMQASFKTGETDPFHHQWSMPVVPAPEECCDYSVYMGRIFGSVEAYQKYSKKVTLNGGSGGPSEVDFLRRPVEDYYSHEKPVPARRCEWVKADGHLGDDYKMHQCCAAYMTDKVLISTSFLPYRDGMKGVHGNFFVTSVDHAIWFHSRFRADEWLLYETESPVCGEGRAYMTGRMWTQDGRLVLSVAQEGVVRTRKAKTDQGSSSATSKL